MIPEIEIRKVNVEIIPHKNQRYETVGDWFYNIGNNTLWIRISDLGDWRYHHLISIHEQIEALLCIKRGISEKEITLFDINYEAKRVKGYIDFQGEPGDHPKAPYRKEHFFATSIERLIAAELEVDWEEYDKTIEAL